EHARDIDGGDAVERLALPSTDKRPDDLRDLLHALLLAGVAQHDDGEFQALRLGHRQEWDPPLRERILGVLVLRLPAPPEGVEEGVEERPNEPALIEEPRREDRAALHLETRD